MRDAGQGVMGPWLGLLEEDVLAEEWILPECSQSPCVTESAHTHKASKRHQTGQRRHATSVRITNRVLEVACCNLLKTEAIWGHHPVRLCMGSM